MSDSTSYLPARPSLEQPREQAKELLRDFRAGDSTLRGCFRRSELCPLIYCLR